MSISPDTPQIVASRLDSFITGFAVGLVAGIGMGVIASSKQVIPSISTAAAGAGSGIAIASFVVNYRHTHRRNLLIAQLNQVAGDRAQLQQQVEQAVGTVAELRSELQQVRSNFDELAKVADAEVQRLRAELAAVHPPIEDAPVVQPESRVTEPPAEPQPAVVS